MSAREKKLSDALKNSTNKSEKDFHVYTGLSGRSNIHNEILKNQGKETSIHFPAFTSTSLNKKVAVGFANAKREPDQHIGHLLGSKNISEVARIKIPAGHARGMYVDHISENDGEKEYLLDKSHVVHFPQQEPTYTFDFGNAIRHIEGHVHKNGEIDH